MQAGGIGRMKILMVHNSYQQHGGEDSVFHAERELLSAAGHDVIQYTRANGEIALNGFVSRAGLAAGTVWARDSYRQLRELTLREKPDVAHFHNTFPLISPAAYYACAEAGVPVLQSLHNARLLCPAATFYRDGHACTDCLGRMLPWPGVLHGCYRNSLVQTGVVAGMLSFHRLLKTWEKRVNTYIVFSEFYRRKFAEAGLPREKITVKPHFVAPDPQQTGDAQRYALFAGRLAAEKGVRTLLEAWKQLKFIPLKVRGDGPLETCVRELADDPHYCIEIVSRLEREELTALFHGARFLVWPSGGYYETFGLVAVEAFACGVPVIASKIGVMAEIVQDGVTGLHFEPGNAADLAAKVEWAWNHPEETARMGRAARAEYEAKYTPERNYKMLMGIYRRAMGTTELEPATKVAKAGLGGIG